MDMFAEQLVEKPQNSSDSLKKVLIIAGGGVIIAPLIILSTVIPFIFILIAGAAYLIYILFTGLNVEYEYTVTNGYLDIDKIIAKRKRVNIVSVEAKDFTAFGSAESIDDGGFNGTTIIAAGGEEERYYAEFSDESHGACRLVFSPDEKVLSCIRPYLPRNLKH